MIKREANRRETIEPLDVLIVGTGFSGLGMGIALKKEQKRTFLILEKANDVGGTWRENHYPGCACDVPAPLYSFSFEQNPEWTRLYAGQSEIYAYLKKCAEKYDLLPHIRFKHEVAGADFDEARGLWTVRTHNGSSFVARNVVFGIGAFSRPVTPQFNGMETFKGPSFHSANWDHSVSLEGKKVAVIGTGASAIQIVPEVAKVASQLTVFQRTPAWVMPKLDRKIGKLERAIYRRSPAVQRLLRTWIYAEMESRAVTFVVKPEWAKVFSWIGKKHIARGIQDPALRDKLTPRDLPGCKRILQSNDYYPALSRSNVNVVTTPIDRISERGIVCTDGTGQDFDAIVYATGFAPTEMITPMKIRGAGGRDLDETWRQEGVQAHLGVMMTGFPNAFMLMGPNTGLGHNSMVFMIEQQIRYALKLMSLAEDRGAIAVDVRAQAQSSFNDKLQKRLGRTVWASGCKSWYFDEKGRNPTTWPGFTFEYWAAMRKPAIGNFLFSFPQMERARVTGKKNVEQSRQRKGGKAEVVA
jgi:cation diffusion facilitator CzcD-associated flavoprotein CzcO